MAENESCCPKALPIELWSVVLSAVDSSWRPVAARVCRDWRAIALDLAKMEASRPPPDVPAAEVESLQLWRRLAGVRQRAAQRSLWLKSTLLADAATLPHGAIDMLAWLRGDTQDMVPAAPRPIPWDAAATEAAARVGNLAALIWLDARGCPLDARRCAAAAAAKGHLAVLGWLRRRHETVSPLEPGESLWHESVYTAAGSCGRIDVLRWLDIEDCPRSPQAFVEAVRAGHLDVVRWLAATNGRVGPFVRPPFEAARAAAERGDVPTLECLYVAGCEGMDDPRLTEVAATQGHVPVLEWLRTRLDPPCPWSRHTAPHAISGRQPDAFEWLVRAGCIIDCNCFPAAAQRANIPLLAWLRRGDDDEDNDHTRNAYQSLITDCDDDGPVVRAQKEAVRRLPGLPKACAWGGSEYATYSNAVCCDDVRLLDWLRAHGLTLTRSAAQASYETAMMYGRVRAAGWMADAVPGLCLPHIGGFLHPIAEGLTRPIAWLHDNGIAWPSWVYADAVEEGRVGLLAWMHAKTGLRYRADVAHSPSGLCDVAAQMGRLDVLDWLVEIGHEHDPDRIMNHAASIAQYNVLKWCHAVRGWPWSVDVIVAAATKYCSAAFVAALRDSGCPWDVRVAEAYAQRGDLDSLVALGPDGRPTDPCPCDQSVIDVAAQNGHHHVVAYLCRFVHPTATY
nr:hypothetical protein [Pandoravirus aubagnensis]